MIILSYAFLIGIFTMSSNILSMDIRSINTNDIAQVNGYFIEENNKEITYRNSFKINLASYYTKDSSDYKFWTADGNYLATKAAGGIKDPNLCLDLDASSPRPIKAQIGYRHPSGTEYVRLFDKNGKTPHRRYKIGQSYNTDKIDGLYMFFKRDYYPLDLKKFMKENYKEVVDLSNLKVVTRVSYFGPWFLPLFYYKKDTLTYNEKGDYTTETTATHKKIVAAKWTAFAGLLYLGYHLFSR